MTDRDEKQDSIFHGFLIHGLLWGIAIGYLAADLVSESNGLLLFVGAARNTSLATACIIIFPAIGLAIGLIFDFSKRFDHHRAEFSAGSGRLLLWCTIIYIALIVFANVPSVR